MASRKPLLIALVLGLLAPCVVLAQPSAVSWPNVVLKYATDGTPILRSRVPLASTAAGGGAATLNASQRLAIGNAMANLQLTRNVPLANVAKLGRIAAFGLGPLGALSLGLELYSWLDGQLMYEPEGDWCYSRAGALTACSVAQALDQYQYKDDAYVGGGVLYSGTWGTSPVVTIGSRNFPGQFLEQWSSPQQQQSQLVPADPAVVESDIASALAAQPALAGEYLDAALASSAARAELLADAMAVTGPATVDGGTTTSTRVETAGTTTIQTQTTYNLSYQGDTVNLTQTQVETLTDPANNVTTTTTTTDTPTGDPPPPDEPPDLCAENPDASGCAPFGTPEPPTPLPQEDRTVSVAPEMSAAGSCPAPQAFSIAGESFQLTYDGACDFAQGIRPVVLVVAWMGAFVFLFSIGRAQTS